LTDVFISHTEKHYSTYKHIKNYLAEYAITTWSDKNVDRGDNLIESTNIGIEKTSNFIFFVAQSTLRYHECVRQLNYAKKLNKRIIPLLIDDVTQETIPNAIKGLKYINANIYTKRGYTSYRQKHDIVLKTIKTDYEYYHKHTILLVQALKWQKQNYANSFLLHGFSLQNAKTWLIRNKHSFQHKPLTLHKKFIEESAFKSGSLSSEVFICYSRKDSDFARKLNDELQIFNKITWFDHENITETSNFCHEIYKGIETSDNFLFIISPDSILSEYCEDEINYAAQLNKRFIPIYYRDIDYNKIPKILAAVQWIKFGQDSNNFEPKFKNLIRTLDNDRIYIHRHTQKTQQALAWTKANKSSDRLLRGDESNIANEWLNQAIQEQKIPNPTELQKEFINASHKYAITQITSNKRHVAFLSILLSISFISLFFAWYLYFEVEAERDYAGQNEEIANRAMRVAREAEIRASKSQQEAIYAKENALQLELFRTNQLFESLLENAILLLEHGNYYKAYKKLVISIELDDKIELNHIYNRDSFLWFSVLMLDYNYMFNRNIAK
jgi:hypothetical protein